MELYLTLLKRKNIMKNICQKLKNGVALLILVTLRAQGGAASSDARQPAVASQHGLSASPKNSLDLTALLTYVTHGMLGFFFLN